MTEKYVPEKYDTRTLTAKKPEVALTLSAFDQEDPRALINICPPRVKQAILDLLDPDKPGNIMWLSWAENRLETELRKQLAKKQNIAWNRYKLDPVDESLRLSFWNEYYRAQDTKTKMKDQALLRGITYPEQWNQKLAEPIFVAWLISPPRGLAMQQEEVLHKGMRLLRRVVMDKDSIYEVKETTKMDDDGKQIRTRSKKLNTKAVAVIQRIVEDLANRTQGAVIQKHLVAAHVKNDTALPTAENPAKRLPQAESREDLEKEIQELEGSVIEGEFDDNTEDAGGAGSEA